MQPEKPQPEPGSRPPDPSSTGWPTTPPIGGWPGAVPPPPDAGQPYPPYAGQPYPDQPYAGQPYPYPPDASQPYPDQPYAGQPYPLAYGYPPAGAVGQPYYAGPMAPATSGWAIASLISSIAGICTIGLGAIVGVIFGHIALSEIKRSNGMQQGRGVAIAGLIIGYAQIAIGILLILIIALTIAANPSVR
ncbi:MAG: DUF4190 domain-containing protein [Ktedonobacterales bacterium]|nr:DUF4190 domain-containing protein [Ktedonobacterales bacterium]